MGKEIVKITVTVSWGNRKSPRGNGSDLHLQNILIYSTSWKLLINMPHTERKYGAMTIHPRFMHPCKSWSLDHRSLFVKSRFVKNENGLRVLH
jgi:hypothetical protein